MSTMKKIIYFALITTIVFGCSKTSSEPFEVFLERWNLKQFQDVCLVSLDLPPLPSKTISETMTEMSTCDLVEIWATDRSRQGGPWLFHLMDPFRPQPLPAVTIFNDKLLNDNVAKELFGRKDCVAVLFSAYLFFIKESDPMGSWPKANFEMLLASDMTMAILNKTEKKQLMAMALEKMKSPTIYYPRTPYIMIAIMRTSNYTPFINSVGTFHEWEGGYRDIELFDVEKYAKQFLDEQN